MMYVLAVYELFSCSKSPRPMAEPKKKEEEYYSGNPTD